jgi:hypothetical protein
MQRYSSGDMGRNGPGSPEVDAQEEQGTVVSNRWTCSLKEQTEPIGMGGPENALDPLDESTPNVNS